MALLEFSVENAGCPSCGALVRDVLEELGTVESVTVDESADLALVRLAGAPDTSLEDVNRLLASVAQGAGHVYRVAPDSWTMS